MRVLVWRVAGFALAVMARMGQIRDAPLRVCSTRRWRSIPRCAQICLNVRSTPNSVWVAPLCDPGLCAFAAIAQVQASHSGDAPPGEAPLNVGRLLPRPFVLHYCIAAFGASTEDGRRQRSGVAGLTTTLGEVPRAKFRECASEHCSPPRAPRPPHVSSKELK